MTDNEREICAINAAARARGMSYGHFVVISTAEELAEITAPLREPKPKKKGKAKCSA